MKHTTGKHSESYAPGVERCSLSRQCSTMKGEPGNGMFDDDSPNTIWDIARFYGVGSPAYYEEPTEG